MPFEDTPAEAGAATAPAGLDAPPAEIAAAGARPWLTYWLIALLAVIFLLQVLLGSWTGYLEPTAPSLTAFGGLDRARVLGQGEWYRLISAPLLHASALHLAMNAIALYIGGRFLEASVGRAWLLTVFTLSAMGGSAASLLLNGGGGRSVGASGAALGIVAMGFVSTLGMPRGPPRSRRQVLLLLLLVPSLIPVASHLGAGTVDFAAHLGGAVVGAAVGALLSIWRPGEGRPPLPRASLVLASAAGLVLTAGFAWAMVERPRLALEVELAPTEVFAELDGDRGESEARLELLHVTYPRDPRLLTLIALRVLERNDRARAEVLLRAGLAEKDMLRVLFSRTKLEPTMRALLARILVDRGEDADARALIRPFCGPPLAGSDVVAGLDESWLDSVCGEGRTP
jgi:rhomboid protease GluP